MAHKQIYYSDKYFDEQYEYRYEAGVEPAEGIREGLLPTPSARGGEGAGPSPGACAMPPAVGSAGGDSEHGSGFRRS